MQSTIRRQTDDSDRKLRELMLYIAAKSESDLDFGATKLNKILFFADLTAFVRHEHSITGQEYQALPRGPAPRRLLPVRKQMEAQGECAIQQAMRFGYQQRRLFALRPAELSMFNGDEIAIVDEVMEFLSGKTAREISDMSHAFLDCWNGLEEGDKIPMEVGFVRSRPLTRAEARYATQLEPNLGR